ncbi:MAG: S-layer homology domain-containing protein, partial [Bacillota bacterium]|nr:S-layer homology domain-containing protein [Bacillota bacterium]
MKKKLLSMLLTAAMIVTSFSVNVVAAPFGDTSGHWGEQAIKTWSDHGVVNGSDGQFRPNDNLTRAEMATIVANLLKLNAMPEGNPFGDLDQNWYTDPILKCYEAGIMSGDGANVRPNDPVTREEAMVILSKALRIKPAAGGVDGFQDAGHVSNWAEGAVKALLDAGIVNGVGGDMLAPKGQINRASVVTILNNAIGNYVTEDGAEIEAKGGLVLVVGGNATIKGNAKDVLILGNSEEVVLDGLKVEGNVQVEGEGTKLVLSGDAKAESITVAENAAGASVEVGAEASVGTVETEAAKTEIVVKGEVSDVKVDAAAAETAVKVEETGKVETVETAAEKVTVSGDGAVSSVTVSGNDTSVTTPGTKVEAAEGTTGVTADGKEVTTGEAAATEPAVTPSGGGGGGGGSSHSHRYQAVVTAPTCTAGGYTTYTCSCGHTYTADEVAALGHSYDAVVTEPTCTAGGYTTYTCSCGDTYT